MADTFEFKGRKMIVNVFENYYKNPRQNHSKFNTKVEQVEVESKELTNEQLTSSQPREDPFAGAKPTKKRSESSERKIKSREDSSESGKRNEKKKK